ncbi:MAG TPA: hypothetical protein VK676_04245 [Steroidobacteraceae bacterium]|jgi:hypothetical protein|nr:hypothetical protein [Steroidobacteraceae bacterium]
MQFAPRQYPSTPRDCKPRACGDAQLVIGPDAQGGTTAILNLPARRSLAEGTLHA